jgi:hypothetical protein
MTTRAVIAVATISAAAGALACSTKPLDAPTLIEVRADRGWQPAGLRVAPNQSFTIEYVSGTIRDREVTIPNANGSEYVCGSADCCEPLPNERRSTLLARVDRQVFVVGNGARVTSREGGRLFLRINDCDEGLSDNAGTLEIRVVP